MSCKIIPFVIAFVLICLVMGVAGVFAFSGAADCEKLAATKHGHNPIPLPKV